MPASRKVRLVIISAAIFCAAGIWPGWRAWRRHDCSALAAACQSARDAEDWSNVGALAARWSECDAASADPWLLRAEAAEKQRDFAAAARFLEHVPVSDSRALAALNQRMNLLFGPLNRPIDAAAACEQILSLDPAAETAHRRLVFFQAMTLQRSRMIRQIRQGIEHGQFGVQDGAYLFLADSLRFSNGPELVRRWLRSSPDDELLTVAEAIHISGNLEGGVPADAPEVTQKIRQAMQQRDRFLAALTDRYPRNAELLAYHLQRALLHGDAERVAALLARSPVEAETDFRFWRFNGWLQVQQGHFDRAEAAFHEALLLHPIDWATRHQLADLYRRMERYDDVRREQELAERGTELKRMLLAVKDVNSVSAEQLAAIARYAEDCGDRQFAEALRKLGASGDETHP